MIFSILKGNVSSAINSPVIFFTQENSTIRILPYSDLEEKRNSFKILEREIRYAKFLEKNPNLSEKIIELVCNFVKIAERLGVILPPSPGVNLLKSTITNNSRA